MGDVTRLLESIHRAKTAISPLGFVEDPVNRERLEADDRRLRAERFLRSRCRVPDAMRQAVIRNELGDTEARRALQSWFDDRDRKPWLVLSGTSGCGKTVAVADLAARTTVKYMRCEEIVRMFAALFGDAAEAQQQVLDAGLLAIDDVGAELDATRMSSALLELLDWRVSSSDTPTVVTTNLTKEQWAARWSDFRIMSRMNYIHWVSLGYERDKRKPAK